MRPLAILGMVLFALLTVIGITASQAVTANVIAGCTCISDACVKACGSAQCCIDDNGSHTLPTYPKWPGYAAAVCGLTGFFLILTLSKKDEEMY